MKKSQKFDFIKFIETEPFYRDRPGQFEVMKSQVLKQIGYDSADLNFAYFDMKEVVYKDVELELVSLPFLRMKKS